MAIRIFEMDNPGHQILEAPFRASQSGTVGVASVQSAAFGSTTTCVHIQSDEACHVVIGPGPTATTGGYKLAAGGEQSFIVTPGDKVAWIQA